MTRLTSLSRALAVAALSAALAGCMVGPNYTGPPPAAPLAASAAATFPRAPRAPVTSAPPLAA